MLPPHKFGQWLIAEDSARMRSRVQRLKFLVNEYGSTNGLQLFHGVLTHRFFEEARWCFVNGQFIACVLLCQCFLEGTLRSLLGAGGKNYGVSDRWLEHAGFCDLIEKAKDCGIITSRQAKDCHAVRQMRVEYVHARPTFSRKHIAYRMIREGKSAIRLSERDARQATKVMLRINQELRERVL